MKYFSRMQVFFRIQIYFVFFRLSLCIYCLETRTCGTKVADVKYFECFWSTKCNPLHKFSFDIYVTFSNCSVDKTERNSSGRAKGKDNEYTKVCVSIRVCVRIQRHLRKGYRLILYTLRSVCIFSILFPIHFPRYWQGDFADQSRAPVLVDHFRYSRDLNVWFRSDIVRRN